MAELIAGRREQFATEERRKSQDGFAQNSRESKRLWNSLEEQDEPRLVGCAVPIKSMDDWVKMMPSSPAKMFIEQTYLFMKAV